MDTFNFLVAILLILMAMQFHQNWLVWGIAAVMILTTKSVMTTIAMVIAVVAIYLVFGLENFNTYLPFVVIGLLVLSLLFNMKEGGGQPEAFDPGAGYADMLGGGGGYGGMGSLGG
jgi:uncharacterized membrane protein YgcG